MLSPFVTYEADIFGPNESRPAGNASISTQYSHDIIACRVMQNKGGKSKRNQHLPKTDLERNLLKLVLFEFEPVK
jgi:hypothetical protein